MKTFLTILASILILSFSIIIAVQTRQITALKHKVYEKELSIIKINSEIDSLKLLSQRKTETINYYNALYTRTLYQLDDERRAKANKGRAIRAAINNDAIRIFNEYTD